MIEQMLNAPGAEAKPLPLPKPDFVVDVYSSGDETIARLFELKLITCLSDPTRPLCSAGRDR